MMNRIIKVVVLALISVQGLHAQESRELKLKEAISLALQNSKSLKVSEEKIREAAARVQQARDHKLPEATVSSSYMRLNQPTVNMEKKSSSGGSAGETAKPSQAIYGMANVSLPLFSGFRIRYGIESARFLEQATRLDAENDREALVQNTIEAYNNLYKAAAAVRLVKENLQAAQQRAKDLASLEKNGLLARNELLKAQLQVSNIELALLDAENNRELANANMDIQLGLAETTQLLLDSTAFAALPAVTALEDYVQAGIHQRKDLAATGQRKLAAETALRSVKAEKYPSLALTGGYIALDVPKVLTVTNAVNIGLGLQYSLSSLWKNKARVQEAQSRISQATLSEGLMEDAIRLQVRRAYQDYLSGRKKIEVYQNAIAQAAENYRIIQNKFANQLATTTELLEADAAQLQARMNLAFAQSDAVVAYHHLLETAGLLTETVNQKD